MSSGSAYERKPGLDTGMLLTTPLPLDFWLVT